MTHFIVVGRQTLITFEEIRMPFKIQFLLCDFECVWGREGFSPEGGHLIDFSSTLKKFLLNKTKHPGLRR